MKIESVIPILYSDDVQRSIEFYTRVLGFAEHWTWDETPTFGGVVNGSSTIFFCKGDQGHKGTWLAINVDNVDEFYEGIKNKGVEISGPPEDKPWFMREMVVKDPDGHILRVGHGIECD
jgi:catechol 2,3-dioxygenase-like lactoylglutathione lyase family enzyme